jgi:hypothetical protein
MGFLQVLKLVLQLLPLILEAIKTVEAASNVSGNGSAKLELVKGLLTSTVDIGNDVDKSQYGAAIEKAIALSVSFFNAVGVFKK